MGVILSLYVPGMFRGVWKNVLTLNVLYTDLSSLWMPGRTHYTHVCILCPHFECRARYTCVCVWGGVHACVMGCGGVQGWGCVCGWWCVWVCVCVCCESTLNTCIDLYIRNLLLENPIIAGKVFWTWTTQEQMIEHGLQYLWHSKWPIMHFKSLRLCNRTDNYVIHNVLQSPMRVQNTFAGMILFQFAFTALYQTMTWLSRNRPKVYRPHIHTETEV